MTVTLELSEDVSSWVQSMPDGSRRIERALRDIMLYESSLVERYGQPVIDRINGIVERNQKRSTGDLSDADVEERFNQVLSRIAQQIDG